MHAVVLTGGTLPGRDVDEVWNAVAALFQLDTAALSVRVLSRTPVTVREVADAQEAHRVRARLMQCGAAAELLPSDGDKWQISQDGSVRGPVPRAYLESAYLSGYLAGTLQVKRATDMTWIPLSSAVAGDTATRVSLSRPAELSSVASAFAEGRTVPPPLPQPSPLPPPLPAGLVVSKTVVVTSAKVDEGTSGTYWLPIPSLVLGIVSVLSLFDDSGWDRDEKAGLFLFSAIGLLLGIIGLSRQAKGRGISIAGVVLSSIALLAWLGLQYG